MMLGRPGEMRSLSHHNYVLLKPKGEKKTTEEKKHPTPEIQKILRGMIRKANIAD